MEFKRVKKLIRFMRANRDFMNKCKCFICLPDDEFNAFEDEWRRYLESIRPARDIYYLPAMFVHPICGYYVNGHRIVPLSSYQEYMDYGPVGL